MISVAIKKVQRGQKEEEAQQTFELPTLGFEFNELNRAVEVLRFFDDAIVPFLKRKKVDDEAIAELSTVFAVKLSSIILRKYQLTIATINLEKAIEIIDEELPNLIKQTSSTVDVEALLKTWSMLKELIRKAGGSGG